jgi:hypothetical protein
VREPLALRERATREVLEEFRNKPFSFATRANCIPLFRAQLVAFGHKVRPLPQYRSAFGAAKALRKAGYTDLAEMLDDLLPLGRIPPSRMLIGDVALGPGEPPFGQALGIFLGSFDPKGRPALMGWAAEDPNGMHKIEIATEKLTGAWRVDWRR